MISPETERAIQKLADMLPQAISELKRWNDHMDQIRAEREAAKKPRGIGWVAKGRNDLGKNRPKDE